MSRVKVSKCKNLAPHGQHMHESRGEIYVCYGQGEYKMPLSGWRKYGPSEYQQVPAVRELVDAIMAQEKVTPKHVEFLEYEHRSGKYKLICWDLDADMKPIRRGDGSIAKFNREGRYLRESEQVRGDG